MICVFSVISAPRLSALIEKGLWLIGLSLYLVSMSTFAEPVITLSRFQLVAKVDDDALAKEYDSLDQGAVVTQADKRLETFRDSVDEGRGGCPITDTAESIAEIAGSVTPNVVIIRGSIEQTWTTSHHELCDFASVSFEAVSSATIRLDASADVAAGKFYYVTISGDASNSAASGSLGGLDFDPGQGTAHFGSDPGPHSRTYSLDREGANAGILSIGVRADFDNVVWEPEGPIERLETYTAEGGFRIRVELWDPDDPSPPPPEVCGSGFDEDRDGDIDGADTECPVPEVCDNGLDDDLDGLIDGADPDCIPPPPPVDLQVRCMHSPIYPMAGEPVMITAQGIDANADAVVSDDVEIYVANMTAPFRSGSDAGGQLLASFTPTGGDFSYGCRAVRGTETAQSWQLANPKLRSVDVGGANNPDWEAQPVIYNGPVKDKIDIVFFHDMTDYTSYTDPAFITAVYNLVNNGLWSMPWFVKNQWAFNIWIARANGADASPVPGPIPPNQTNPNCNRTNANEIQNIFNKKYRFRDAGAIVHSRACRDNASVPRTFTITASAPNVLAHEMGHRPFGMKDEYCRNGTSGQLTCDGGHGQNNPFANQYKTENGCRDSAAERPYEADDCRLLVDTDSKTWWLGEPRYSIQSRATQVRDLMQQTGTRQSPPGSGTFVPAYKVGLTEIDRMNWFLQECIDGKCGHQIR